MHVSLRFGREMIEIRRLAPLVLVVLLAASCGGSSKKSAANTTGTPTTTTRSGDQVPMPTTPTPTPNPKGPRGSALLMGTQNLYPLLGKDLAAHTPTQVTGTNIPIVAIDGPDTFWAGRSKTERLFVHIRLKGESAPTLRIGQKVDFVGQLTDNTGAGGLKAGSGNDLLKRQGAYLDVSIADLKLK